MNEPISIKIDRDAIRRIQREFLLMSDEVPVATSRAINRTLSAVNTEASKQVRKYYKLKAARVKKNFTTRKASKNNMNAAWQSRGEPVGLMQFGAKQNKRGVSVKVMTDDRRKTVDHAFIQIGNNNQRHVFWRAKQRGVVVGRYPIERLSGPRIEDALSKPPVQKALQVVADDTLQKRLDAEANYILSKAR